MSLALPAMLFALGLVDDILVSVYTRAASHGQAWLAGSISLILALFNVGGLFIIIEQRSIVNGICYASGCFIGTVLGVKVGARK